MGEVVVRPAVAGDAAAVAGIWRDGWRDGRLGNVPDERVAVRTGDRTVATVDGEVAGLVMVGGDEVEQVYVSSRHRGTGVASVLLAEAERQVAAAGDARAWLAVVAGNARARRFYERHGWADEGLFEHEAPDAPGAVRVPAHRYVKPVAPPA